ncbi:hypothetical protein [uncultured Rhodoblastus sp.]|uniref:hypothetical protein n=1 Tax=uncultured Rhodoblastus sp. TaxID=543037 RepID=UPI0025DC3716|nr:hypothetical protein [uncultured Rhodoblastus sp.]
MASDPREMITRKRSSRLAEVGNIPADQPANAVPAASRKAQSRETALDRVNRDLAILNMRLHGLTFHEIARKLPEAGFGRVSVSRIYAIVTKNLRSCREPPARELRQLELLRLDQLQAAHYPAAMGGDSAAASRVLSIMDRRAKLLGLDAGAEAASSLDEARKSLLKKLDSLARGQAAPDRGPEAEAKN